MEVLGVLRAGHSVGEYGALIAARATAAVRARDGACVIGVPIEAVDAVAFGLPDVVDEVHEIKLIATRRRDAGGGCGWGVE